MHNTLDRFIYRHWPRSFLLALVGLLVAAGLWWLAEDYALRVYPQEVANSIPVPLGVELVDMQSGYTRKCKRSGIIQYFTTDVPWETIVASYIETLNKDWQLTGDGVGFYQSLGDFEQLKLTLHHIDVTSEGKPKDPFTKQIIFKGRTAYSVQISYNQDLRVSRTVCKPED